MKINSVIIDDDPFIKDLLCDKIEQFLPDIKIMGTAGSGEAGIALIKKHNPDLIFLDVEMEDMTGFEMLEQIGEISFDTIFITSYVHYAIKAIRFNALDYLVKPIDLGELKKAIKRFEEKRNSKTSGRDVRQALQNMKTTNASEQKFTLNTHDGEMQFALKDIVRFEGERNYSYIFLSNGKKKLASKTLGDFEEILSDKGFFRIHKSHLVNRIHIETNKKDKFVKLLSGEELPVSRRKKEMFSNWYLGE